MRNETKAYSQKYNQNSCNKNTKVYTCVFFFESCFQFFLLHLQDFVFFFSAEAYNCVGHMGVAWCELFLVQRAEFLFEAEAQMKRNLRIKLHFEPICFKIIYD